MTTGNKLLALIFLPFVTILGLALLFLIKVEIPQSGLSSEILNLVEGSKAPEFQLPMFSSPAEKIDFSDYDSIPQYQCRPGDMFSKELKQPIFVSWEASTTGAVMQSGSYYAFKKIPDDSKYPVFGGTLLNGPQNLDGVYLVSGFLKGIECGPYVSVFGWQSHPEVDIQNIEPLE